MEIQEEFTTIESIFVRHRNALFVRGQFTSIYTDYYLHLMQHSIRPPAELDQMLKDTLAMLTLHLVARPWAETIAWTSRIKHDWDRPFDWAPGVRTAAVSATKLAASARSASPKPSNSPGRAPSSSRASNARVSDVIMFFMGAAYAPGESALQGL